MNLSTRSLIPLGLLIVLALAGYWYISKETPTKDVPLSQTIPSSVSDFNQADYDEALRTDKLIVLYFYANWCPYCRAEFPVMQGVFEDTDKSRVIGFRVSYNDSDTSAEEKNLAREFGVIYQHTKVFVRGGTQVLKSPETWDAARYKEEINTHLQ